MLLQGEAIRFHEVNSIWTRVECSRTRELFFSFGTCSGLVSPPLAASPRSILLICCYSPPPFGPSYRQGVATRSSSSSSLTSRDSLPLSILLHPLCHPGLVSPLLRARMEGMCFPFFFFPKSYTCRLCPRPSNRRPIPTVLKVEMTSRSWGVKVTCTLAPPTARFRFQAYRRLMSLLRKPRGL